MLDAYKDLKVVRWCRTQASSHNLQGVVDGEVNKAGICTAAPNRLNSAASIVRRVMLASCEVTQGVGCTWATCPTLLRGIWARSRRAGFRCWSWLSAHVWLPCCWDERLPTPFSWCFSFQLWKYSPSVAMSLLSAPSTASQSPSACMIARSSAYAYFLEMMAGRSEV